MNTYEVGTPAIDMYGNTGFISAVMEPTSTTFVLSRGMQQVRTEYEVCFDSGRISVLSDGIVKPFVDRASHLPKVEDVDARKAAIQAMERASRAAAQEKQEQAQERAKLFYAEAEKRMPRDAKAVIVAEYHHDRSDSMSDYFGHSVGRGAILDAIRAAYPSCRLATYERHSSLREILSLKGYDLAGSDFMEAEE
ncbi:MAG: hypothetical protein K0M55_16015, partial [Rhizobium sp.]|nr:hypothetical protein [Rhizobium sp.]MBW8321986.1 hypothetical protein [Rhizobium sp.]